jgi:hypothetical protein
MVKLAVSSDGHSIKHALNGMEIEPELVEIARVENYEAYKFPSSWFTASIDENPEEVEEWETI